MDYVQSHEYGAPDVAGSVSSTCLAKTKAYGKPHLFAECGADTEGRLDDDPVILRSVLHDGLWAAMLSGGAGTAMTWFWESVDRNNLYGEFSAVAAYAAGVDWVKEGYQSAPARVQFPAGRRPAAYGPVTVSGLDDPWSRESAAARPQTFRVGTDGVVSNQQALSRVLHGVRNHPDLHNPVTFEVDYPAAGQFIVNVERAAPQGATLVVTLDGKPALSQDFPRVASKQRRAPSGKSKSYAIEVSAGPHAITLENTGTDWLYATYRLTNYLDAPNLRVLALANRHSALVWCRTRTIPGGICSKAR